MTGKLSGGCLVPIGTLSNVSDRDMPPRRRGGSRRTRQTAAGPFGSKGYGLQRTAFLIHILVSTAPQMAAQWAVGSPEHDKKSGRRPYQHHWCLV